MPLKKTVTVYTFDELPPDVRAKVIDRHRENNDFEIYQDDYLFTAQKELAAVGFTDAKITYSGFSSQGDGASFDARFDLEKILTAIDYPTRRKALLLYLFEEAYLTFSIEKNHFATHYSHKYTRSVEASFDTSRLRSSRRLRSLVEDLEEKIEALRLSECDKIYEGLEAEYEHATHDDTIEDILRASKHLFTATGKLFSYRED